MKRLVALDAMRGLLMVLMALDHANAFVARRHSSGEFWAGAMPQYDSALAMIARLVTHVCAPGFSLLMAAGMTLFALPRLERGWSHAAIAGHFVVRGAILVGINVAIESVAWLLGSTTMAAQVRGFEAPALGVPAPGGGSSAFIYAGVLTALGLGMAVGGVLLRLSSGPLLAIGAGAVVFTHVFTPDPSRGSELFTPLARILLVPGHTDWLLVVYPLIPWIAVLAPGLVLGRLLARDPERAYRGGLVAGQILLAAFVFIRVLGGAGNLRPPEGPGWMAFLNLTKYPPSFPFLALTLGVNLTLLFLLSRAHESRGWLRPLLVFGRTPLFFYLTHLYLFALIGLALGVEGIGIPRMLPIWILGLVVLYPLCARYDVWKRGTAPDSFWRLL